MLKAQSLLYFNIIINQYLIQEYFDFKNMLDFLLRISQSIGTTGTQRRIRRHICTTADSPLYLQGEPF
jgi:hypothetical protein